MEINAALRSLPEAVDKVRAAVRAFRANSETIAAASMIEVYRFLFNQGGLNHRDELVRAHILRLKLRQVL